MNTRLLCAVSLFLILNILPAHAESALPAKAIAVRDSAGTLIHPLAAAGRTATVLIFIASDCPIANSYTAKIERIRRQYSDSHIALYVVYTDVGVPLSQLEAHARAHGYQDFALFDTQHQLVRLAGATVTPEAVVLSPQGEILYQGAIDNRYTGFGIERDTASQDDLRDALNDICASKSVAIPHTTPIGCFIPSLS
jgi:hypothetical protein